MNNEHRLIYLRILHRVSVLFYYRKGNCNTTSTTLTILSTFSAYFMYFTIFCVFIAYLTICINVFCNLALNLASCSIKFSSCLILTSYKLRDLKNDVAEGTHVLLYLHKINLPKLPDNDCIHL